MFLQYSVKDENNVLKHFLGTEKLCICKYKLIKYTTHSVNPKRHMMCAYHMQSIVNVGTWLPIALLITFTIGRDMYDSCDKCGKWNPILIKTFNTLHCRKLINFIRYIVSYSANMSV